MVLALPQPFTVADVRILQAHDPGPIATLPAALRTAFTIVLDARIPMAVASGPELRLFYNDHYALLLGAAHPRVLGEPATDHVDEMRAALHGNAAVIDGHSFSPIRDDAGMILGVLTVATSVEPRDLAAKFTAILGHDLRNPLNAIATAAQLLERRAATADIARPAKRIVLSVDRMSRMLNQLLDLSRMRAAGDIRLEARTSDIGELCQLVLGEVWLASPDAKIELETTGSLVGRWDGPRLAQVLANIVGNAVDHGEPSTTIHVGLDGRDPAVVEIRVENRGAIPEDVLATLFDPFRGIQHRRDATRGLGLGLYISREIIVAHGGTLDVRSTRGEGTCVAIRLPKHNEVAP